MRKKQRKLRRLQSKSLFLYKEYIWRVHQHPPDFIMRANDCLSHESNSIKPIESGVIPRPVRTLVVGISWHNVAYLGKLVIEETAYYEIATPLRGSQ